VFIFISVLFIGLNSCRCRYDDENNELSLSVSFYDSLTYRSPLDYYKEVEVVGLDEVITLDSSGLALPIDPRATEMTYIFKGDTLQDTLRFFYTIGYDIDQVCGYSNRIDNIQYDSTSSFKDIQFNGIYSPYVQINF